MSAPATDFAALVRACQQVLADGHGSSSVLPVAFRFSLATHPDQDPTVKARRARRLPLALVTVVSQRARGLSTTLPVMQRDVRVRVDFAYFAGREEQIDARRLAQGRAADDALRVSAAFEAPGNLTETMAPESAPTGLAGGLLQFQAWELRDPGADDRLLEATATFAGIVELVRPT